MDDELRKKFAENLRDALNRADKTQADMAKYMGISTATASDWFNGQKMPRVDKIQSLCNWLQIELTDLLIEPSWRQPPSDGYLITGDLGSHQVAINLNKTELNLIEQYRQLNEEGQERLHEYALDLIASGRYKKDNPAQLDKEA
ncbi:MAG: helix-turn-helix domain-containing protein [Firmicutes bacterium]|nr:helix-turn-helix domain-containing protein [Bacillota bacterium]